MEEQNNKPTGGVVPPGKSAPPAPTVHPRSAAQSALREALHEYTGTPIELVEPTEDERRNLISQTSDRNLDPLPESPIAPTLGDKFRGILASNGINATAVAGPELISQGAADIVEAYSRADNYRQAAEVLIGGLDHAVMASDLRQVLQDRIRSLGSIAAHGAESLKAIHAYMADEKKLQGALVTAAAQHAEFAPPDNANALNWAAYVVAKAHPANPDKPGSLSRGGWTVTAKADSATGLLGFIADVWAAIKGTK